MTSTKDLKNKKTKVARKPRARKGTIEEQQQRDKFTRLRNFLRRCWMKWPERIAAKIAARRPSQSSNKRLKWESQCAVCEAWFAEKETQVDHIIPAGTFLCDDDYKTFVPGLLCSRTNIQVLCKPCHATKTAGEKK